MDFKSMKRKELQRLCKKHKMPANLSNLEMANKLTEFFKEKENPLVQGLIKGQDEKGSETDSTDVVMNRKVKKVRFSPEHELIEFTKSRELKRRSKRNSISSTNSDGCVENVDNGKVNNENVGILGRVTRSRGLELMEGKMNENKRGNKSSKCYDQKDNVSAIENFDNGQLRGSDVHISGRVTRLRGKILAEGVKNASKRGRKRAKDEDERDKKALDSVNGKKLIEEIVDNPGRVTRSRGQKLMEGSIRMENRGRKVVKNIDKVALVSAETDENRVVSENPVRKRGVVGEEKLARASGQSLKSNGKGSDEVLESDKTAGLHVMIEPQILLRRSKRNANKVGDSAILNDDTRQHENGGIKGLKKTAKNKVYPNGRVVVQVEEPIKLEPRRSNRRKSVIASHENQGNGALKAENGRRYPLRRSSVPELVIANGISKDGKNAPKPTEVLRRSRRKVSSLKLVSGDENVDTDAAVENFETEKLLRKPRQVQKRCSAVQKNKRRSGASRYKSLVLDEFSGDSFIQQKNEARKRKRGPISGGDVMKTNNDPSSATQSMKENRSEKAAPAAAIGEVAIGKSLFVEAQVSNVSEGAESTNNKPHREKQNVSIADTAGNELENSEENAASRIAELNTDSEKQIFASKIRDVEKAHSVLELDVQELIQQDITNMDKNELEVQVFSRAENSSSNALIDNKILPEGSNVSGNEGFAETSSSADSLLLGDQTDFKTGLEVTDAEADKHALPSADVVEHFGEVEGITVQENLEFAENVHSLLEFDVQELIEQDISNMDKNDPEAKVFRQAEDSSSNALSDNQILPEGSNVSGNEGFHENSCYTGSLLLGDQTDFKTGVEVEFERISVQENLKIAETEQANVIISPISCHRDDVDHLEASKIISGNNNKDTSPKSGEIGAFESCERCIDSTDSKSALQIKKPSSGKLRRHEGDITAEGDETYLSNGIESKIAETDKGECLKDHKNGSNEDSGFSVPDLLDAERSAGIIPQDRRNFSGECSAMASHEQGMYNDSLTVSLITICTNSSEIDPNREREVDYNAKRDEILNDKSMHSEVAETDQGGPSKDHKSQCGEDGKFRTSNLCHAERTAQDREIFSGEISIMGFDEQGMFLNSLPLAPATISDCAEINLRRDDAHKIAEAHESYVCKDIQSELGETDEGGWLENHKRTKDEDWEFGVSNLSHGEKSAKITPEDKVIFSSSYSVKDINEQVIFHDFPALSIMRASCNEVECTAGSSSSQGIGPSKPNSASEKVDQEAGAAGIQEKEVASSPSNTPGDEMSMDKTNSDGERQIFNQADERMCKYTYEREEKPRRPLAKPTAIANTMQGEEASSSASESAGHTMCILKTNSKEETTLVVEGSDTDEDDNDKSRGKDKEGFADVLIADAEVSMDYTIRKTAVGSLSELKFQDPEETENQCKNLPSGQTELDVGGEPTAVESSQSRTEIDLNNLFGATVDNISPTRLNDTSSQGTEIANVIMSMNKSIASSDGSFTQKKKEMEGEKGSECESEEKQLKLLFATPIKTAYDRELDGAAMLIPECVGTMKENAETHTKPDEKVRDAASEPEEDTNEELNEVKSLGLVNISTTVLSEAENDGCGASEGQLNDDTCECLKETNFVREENKEEKIIPPGQSCLYDKPIDNDSESMEKNIISSSGSMKNLDKLEGSQDMLIDTDLPENISRGSRVYLKSEEERAQSSVAPFELSDVDFQKSNVLENSHHRTGSFDGSILRGTAVYTYSGPLNEEVANTGSFDGQKEVMDRGTSPGSSPKASHDDNEVTERKDVKTSRDDDVAYGAKVCDETVGSPRSSHDRTDELLTNNSGVAFKEIGTTIQNVDNMVIAAETASFVYGAEFDTLSSPALHLLFGHNENADNEKSEEGTPVFILEGDHEKNGKEVKENSTARTVQVSIPELHLEERFADFNNDVQTVSDVSAFGCDSCGPSLPIDVLAHIDERTTCENAALCESGDDIDGRASKSEDKDDKPSFESLETEGKELEIAKLFMEPATGSGEAVISPAYVDLLVEGSTATGNRPPLVESEDGQRSHSIWTAKKNARTILIHGTPAKLPTMADMKENAPKHKSSNVVGDVTAVRPATRRALQDVQWK